MHIKLDIFPYPLQINVIIKGSQSQKLCMKPNKLLSFALALGLAISLIGCQRQFTIPQALFAKAWQHYQREVFVQGWRKALSREDKIKLLEKAASQYKIPTNRMRRYVSRKYPIYFQKLTDKSS